MSDSLRLRLSDYLANRISLSDFEEWFIPAFWDADPPNESDAALVADVELRLAEYSNGHLSANELRDALRSVAQKGSFPC